MFPVIVYYLPEIEIAGHDRMTLRFHITQIGDNFDTARLVCIFPGAHPIGEGFSVMLIGKSKAFADVPGEIRIVKKYFSLIIAGRYCKKDSHDEKIDMHEHEVPV